MLFSNSRRATRPILLSLAAGAIFILGTTTTFLYGSVTRESVYGWIDTYNQPEDVTLPASHGGLSAWGHRSSVKHNLRPEEHYLIAFHSAGWNNQVIATMRVLTPFISKWYHNGHGGLELKVGDVFDLDGLAASMGRPVLEFDDLKGTNRSPLLADDAVELLRKETRRSEWREGTFNGTIFNEAPQREEIACWAFWAPVSGGFSLEVEPDRFDLNFNWTPLPLETFNHDDGLHLSMDEVAQVLSIDQSYGHEEVSQKWIDHFNLPEPALAPDNHLACLDETYYIQAEPGNGWAMAMGRGAWGTVGKLMRWHPMWLEKAEGYTRRLFEVPEGEPLPMYISMHIRRGDFVWQYHEVQPRDWAFAVSQMQQRLLEEKGLDIRNVLIATNEKDETWTAQFDKYEGFKVVNHTKMGTLEWDPEWAPVILDAVMLSSGMALIGFHASTMTVLAERRVVEWHGGLSHFVDPYMRAPGDWEYPYLRLKAAE